MDVMKHTGYIKNTGKRCALAFLQLPEKPTHALVIDTDALPEKMSQIVASILSSPEAQNANALADVLARRMMHDEPVSVLHKLHNMGYLVPQPIENVMLTPRTNLSMPLTEVLKAMGTLPTATSDAPMVMQDEVVSKETMFSDNSKADVSETKKSMAKNFLMQAMDLEIEAKRKREEAYRLDPSLAPAAQPKAEAAPLSTPKVEQLNAQSKAQNKVQPTVAKSKPKTPPKPANKAAK